MRVLFSSDIHGNEQHLAALREVVAEMQPDVLIYLGDISPNRFMYENAEYADEYNLKRFFPVIEALNVPYKYVMPGNTDFHLSKLRYYALFTDPRKCKFIYSGVISINSEIDVLFYHYTKFSPHSMKDGEQFDLSKLRRLHQQTTQRTVTENIDSENSLSEESDEVSRSHPQIQYKQRAGSFMPQSCMLKLLAQAAMEESSSESEPQQTEEELLFQEHQQIESRARVKYVKTEKICTNGVVSGIFDFYGGKTFIMADALIYSCRFYYKVDIFLKNTQPEWFYSQLTHTIEQNMRFLTAGTYHHKDSLAKCNQRIKIWALHGPISDTIGDRLRSGDHVGSKGMRIVMEDFPPELVVSGHIHEACRDGYYKCYETNHGKETCIVSVGNEALVMPFCLKAAFVVVDLNETTGKVLRTYRLLRDVSIYEDANEAFKRFKEVSARLQQMHEQQQL